MAKLSKAQAKAHQQACDILTKPRLTEEEKEFVFRNWHEGANHVNGAAGAFFTPFDMAFDFAFDVGGPRVIDLCAGIGMLSYAVYQRHRYGHHDTKLQITCVERNADYVEAGRKLVPEADWICADVLDLLEMVLGRFDWAISNPPFGNIKRLKNAPRYAGRDFEFHVIDVASHLADNGTFIVPQISAGFNYSARPKYERQKNGKAVKFQELTGLHFDAGCGVDTAFYKDEWKGVSPICEIVCVDFEGGESITAAPVEKVHEPHNSKIADDGQLDMFGRAA
ncbi:MAG: methyltransferase [Nitratireductor sp.]|uniref:methyltransferase n=1 Tax=Nitratireductor sp. TaxID=1872084 RepID=UPI00262B80D5|nr:methyltransferase [Nitratireductor sp.]MCV0348481.1 methyltransferase [Nitratireductor sp.]